MEASKQGWGELHTQLRGWMSFISEEMGKARWDFTNEILEETEHRQLELEPWIAATAKSARLSDLLRWEHSTAQ